MATLQINAARTQFTDAKGVPLVGGTVTTYVPETTVPVTTYQDPLSSVNNTNPIVLDSIGSASIWYDGYVRMIVKDAAGNQIYDQVGGSSTSTTSAQKVYVVASGFTLNDSTPAAQKKNAALLQSFFNQIPSGAEGIVEIQQDWSVSGNPDIYLDGATAPNQGSRSITLRTPPSCRLRNGWPTVARYEGYLEGMGFVITGNNPVVTDITSRADVFGERAQYYYSASGTGYNVATRRDFIKTISTPDQTSLNVAVSTIQLNATTDNSAHWQYWNYQITPLSNTSGAVGAPTVPQSGAYITMESNIANQIGDPGYHSYAGAYAPLTIIYSAVPEHGPTTSLVAGGTTRFGFHNAIGFYLGPNGDVASVSSNGIVPKTYAGYMIDRNGIAPGGSGYVANGNTRSTSIGNGGDPSPTADPGSVIEAHYYWKAGIDFRDAVITGNAAMILADTQTIACYDPVATGYFQILASSAGSTFLTPNTAGGVVYIGNKQAAKIGLKVDANTASSDTYAAITAGVASTSISAITSVTNADLTLAAAGTGSVTTSSPLRGQTVGLSGANKHRLYNNGAASLGFALATGAVDSAYVTFSLIGGATSLDAPGGTGGLAAAGSNIATWTASKFTFSVVPKLPSFTVSGLPSAASNQDCMAVVTDSTVAMSGNYGATVAGGGANRVKVWSNGTNWLIA